MSHIKTFLRDLFTGVSNKYWDLGRIIAFLCAIAMVGGAIWNAVLGQPLDLGPSGLGGGLASVITALAALIGVKDYVRHRSGADGTSDA